MFSRQVSRHAVCVASAVACLSVATPVLAARGIVIDRSVQNYQLTSCDAFAGCLQLDGRTSGTVYISPTGFIEIGRGANAIHFSIAESDTVFQVLNGFTPMDMPNAPHPTPRTDFIDFYRVGESTTANGADNRPTPDFQIRFDQVTTRPGFTDLAISFNYNRPLASGANQAPIGAKIGVSGATIGTRAGSTVDYPGTPIVGGFAFSQYVTNRYGLLLGAQPGDSEFSFTIGDVPTLAAVKAGSTYPRVRGLVSETFDVRRAPGSFVPETPEPATWAMLLTGFGVVGGAMRQRRNRVAAIA